MSELRIIVTCGILLDDLMPHVDSFYGGAWIYQGNGRTVVIDPSLTAHFVIDDESSAARALLLKLSARFVELGETTNSIGGFLAPRKFSFRNLLVSYNGLEYNLKDKEGFYTHE